MNTDLLEFGSIATVTPGASRVHATEVRFVTSTCPAVAGPTAMLITAATNATRLYQHLQIMNPLLVRLFSCSASHASEVAADPKGRSGQCGWWSTTRRAVRRAPLFGCQQGDPCHRMANPDLRR